MKIKPVLNKFRWKIHFLVKRIAGYENNNVICIYSQAKTATTHVYKLLKKNKIPCYRIHTLQYEKLKQETEHKYQAEGIKKLLKKNFEHYNWKIITLVRDPVAVNLSYFFNKKQSDNKPRKEYIETNWSDRLRPLTWFNEEVKEFFDVDLFENPFPKGKGFSIITYGNVDILTIKVEKMDAVLKSALEALLKTKIAEENTSRINDTAKKQEQYREIIDNIKITKTALSKFYNSHYMHHFYSFEEIKMLENKWLN